MDGDRVSKAWCKEFYRLRGKVFVDEEIVKKTLLEAKAWSPQTYKSISNFEELFSVEEGENISFKLDDLDFGAEEEKEEEVKGGLVENTYDNPDRKPRTTSEDYRSPHTFTMHNMGRKHSLVQICGSFDNWEKRHNMTYDNYTSQWFLTLHLAKGTHFYKYIINEKDWVVNERESKQKDKSGNTNNVVSF